MTAAKVVGIDPAVPREVHSEGKWTSVWTDRASRSGSVTATAAIEKGVFPPEREMDDQHKTKKQLAAELAALRQQVAALRQSEERYRALAESLPHPVGRYDAEGKLIEYNCRWYEFTGQTGDEARGEGWLKALHPDDVERTGQAVQEALTTGQFFESEHRLRRASDGKYRWHLARAIPTRDANGAIIGWFSSCIDIDDQKQAEGAFQRSEERFRKVFEEGPIGVALVGPDSRIQQVNRRMCEMLGYSEEEIIALGIKGITHPEDVEKDRQLAMNLFCNAIPSYTIEKRYVCKDGRVIWGQLTASLMHDSEGHPTIGIDMIADITEWKQANQRLRENERLLRTLIDASPESILLVDTTGTILLANETSAQRLGRPVGEIVGRKPRDLMPGEVAAVRIRHFEEVICKGEPIRFEDNRSGRFYENVMHPVLDEQGSVVAVAVLAIDRTEQKQAQKVLQEDRDDLEQKIEERTAELAIFRRFAEASGEGFGMSDFDGRIVYVNPTLCRLFGEEKPENVVGKNVSAYYPAEYVQRRQKEMIPALLRDGHWYAEQMVLLPQGKAIPTLQSTFLIRDDVGNPLQIAVVVTDITERKRAEGALRRSEERFHLAQQVARVGTFERNVQTGDSIWTRELEALYGLSPGSFPGTEAAWENLIHVDDRADILRLVERAYATGEPVEGEWRVMWPDGSVHWLAGRWQAFKDDSGKPLRVIGVNIDITERRLAQEGLAKEQQTLKHLLQSSDHERQLIAYEIHDGLAQQLAGAIMQFQTFDHMKDKNPGLAAKAYGAGLTMLQQGHFETRRLIAGVRPPILDESGVVAALAHLVHEQGRSTRQELDYQSRVDFDRLAPTLENTIYRIAQEGLMNACQHSNSKKVLVRLFQRGDKVRIEIRDWGIGFDPKKIPKNRFGVEGLRQRARLLSGKCSIRSRPGKGTRIIVDLPVVGRD